MAEPHGPDDPDKSAVNASSQPNALIGSDRHSGPYASFMPLRPQKPGVGEVCVCVCVCLSLLHYSAPAVGGLCLWFLPLVPLTQQYALLWSAECVCPCVSVTPRCSLFAYMRIQRFSAKKKKKPQPKTNFCV